MLGENGRRLRNKAIKWYEAHIDYTLRMEEGLTELSSIYSILNSF